jgi:hypothetical protein
VGSREVAGEAPVERSWAILGSELALKQSAGDIIAMELDEGQDDGVDGEEEEMVVTLQYVLSTYCRSLRPFHT